MEEIADRKRRWDNRNAKLAGRSLLERSVDCLRFHGEKVLDRVAYGDDACEVAHRFPPRKLGELHPESTREEFVVRAIVLNRLSALWPDSRAACLSLPRTF